MSIVVVGSPPYAGSLNSAQDGIDWSRVEGGTRDRTTEANYRTHNGSGITAQHYGSSPGQLGALPPGMLDTSQQPTTPAPVTTWQGCYSDGWQDLICPESFAHPAKFARGLIHRIYRHLIERGYVQAGATILDPFGGVGLGALDALTYGLRYVGVELEPRFVTLAQQNLELWRQRYGFTGGTVVQGDSRQLRAVLAGAQVGCCVASPPFHASLSSGETAADMKARWPESQLGGNWGQAYGTTPGQLGAMPPGAVGAVVGSPPWHNSQEGASVAGPSSGMWKGYDKGFRPTETGPIYASSHEHYGTTPGQLGAMPPGAVVSSPPYAGAGEVLGTHNGIDWSKAQDGGKVATPARQASGEGYGTAPGQLGAMPPGAIGAVVGSPPYAEGLSKEHTYSDHAKRDKDSHRRIMTEKGIVDPFYGVTDGQLGAEPSTFWAASAQIMAELSALLPPGAVCAWVVKAYVSKKAIVPFPDQWRALCEAHGFVLLEEIHASLVEHHGTQEGLFGESSVVQTERKSFFRRLAEKKGSPRIDYETVLIVRKAGDTGGVCCVSSPPFGESLSASAGIDKEERKRVAMVLGKTQEQVTPADLLHACQSSYGTTPGNLGTMPVEKTP